MLLAWASREDHVANKGKSSPRKSTKEIGLSIEEGRRRLLQIQVSDTNKFLAIAGILHHTSQTPERKIGVAQVKVVQHGRQD